MMISTIVRVARTGRGSLPPVEPSSTGDFAFSEEVARPDKPQFNARTVWRRVKPSKPRSAQTALGIFTTPPIFSAHCKMAASSRPNTSLKDALNAFNTKPFGQARSYLLSQIELMEKAQEEVPEASELWVLKEEGKMVDIRTMNPLRYCHPDAEKFVRFVQADKP